MKKLNLGCGQNKIDGFVNVDKFSTYKPDVVWDLESFPWPFETNSTDEILLNHSLEHMGASPEVFFTIMKELYRVSSPDCNIMINVPHPRGESFAGDPTHVRPITTAIMSLFSKANCKKWKEKGEPNTPLADYLDVDFERLSVQYKLAPHWQKKLDAKEITGEELNYAALTYYNVIDEIRLVLKVVK